MVRRGLVSGWSWQPALSLWLESKRRTQVRINEKTLNHWCWNGVESLKNNINNPSKFTQTSSKILLKNNINNPSKMTQTPSKILPKSIRKRPQIDENVSLERFRRQVATRSASGCCPSIKGLHHLEPFGPKMCQKGQFLGPPWIQNGSKIAPSRIGWHLDPLKMVSGRGFGKNMKIQWKTDAKIEGFRWLRTTFGVILFAYNTLSPFSEKIEKSMPKGSPKVEVFATQTDLGRPRVDWFCHLGRFLGVRKIVVFSMSFCVVKKSIKIDPWVVLGRFRRHFAPRSAPGRSPSTGVLDFWRVFGWKCRSKGHFCGPPWIQNGCKIVFLSIDRRLAPRKMTSGRGVGNNLEN